MPSVYSGRRFFWGSSATSCCGRPRWLNVLLWIAAVVATLLALSRWQRAPLTGGRRWMLPVLVVFAGLVVWRDSPWLVSLDIFAIVVALTLALCGPRGPSIGQGCRTTRLGSGMRAPPSVGARSR